MNSTTDEKKPCRCTQCGNGCSHRKETPESKPEGFFARRPWIWVMLGYVAMVSVLCSMVVIAVKHQQKEVPLVHGR